MRDLKLRIMSKVKLLMTAELVPALSRPLPVLYLVAKCNHWATAAVAWWLRPLSAHCSPDIY